MDEYLTTDQIAQRLGVKVATVRRWVHQGKLHGLSLGRAGYRILQEDFDRFVQRRSQQLQQLTHSPPPNGRDEFPIEAISTLILERMTDGVLLFGPDGLCQYVNESAMPKLNDNGIFSTGRLPTSAASFSSGNATNNSCMRIKPWNNYGALNVELL